MPQLNQIQTNIKTRRKAVGNNNNIDELKQFLTSIRHNANTTGDKLFPFGVELVDGSANRIFIWDLRRSNCWKDLTN